MDTLTDHLAPFGARAPLEADAAFLARLYASTRQDLLGFADPAQAAPLIAMQQRLQTAGYLASFPEAQYLILQHGGEPAARIVVDQDPGRIRLVDIAVVPEARGRGFGTAILRALQQWSAARGLPMVLAVHHSNPAARRLYVTLGFQPESADAVSTQLRWHG